MMQAKLAAEEEERAKLAEAENSASHTTAHTQKTGHKPFGDGTFSSGLRLKGKASFRGSAGPGFRGPRGWGSKGSMSARGESVAAGAAKSPSSSMAGKRITQSSVGSTSTRARGDGFGAAAAIEWADGDPDVALPDRHPAPVSAREAQLEAIHEARTARRRADRERTKAGQIVAGFVSRQLKHKAQRARRVIRLAVMLQAASRGFLARRRAARLRRRPGRTRS